MKLLRYWVCWSLELLRHLIVPETTFRRGDMVHSIRHGLGRIVGPPTRWGFVPVTVENVPGLVLVMATNDLTHAPYPAPKFCLPVSAPSVIELFRTGAEWSMGGQRFKVWTGIPDDALVRGIKFDQASRTIFLLFDSQSTTEQPQVEIRVLNTEPQEPSVN